MTPDLFTHLRRTLSVRLSTSLVALFRNLGAWRDPDADRFVAQAVPLVQGSQRALASLTAVYVADRAAEAAGRVVGPPPIPGTASIGLRRGIEPGQVYRRPFVTLRMSLSGGDDLPTAVDRGSNRLVQIAEGDMQQTHAESARAAMQALSNQPSGWRRVLVGTENCALCVVASTQLYNVDTLNPLHHNCNCRVEPVFGSHPAVSLERAAQVKAAVEELSGGRTSRAKDLRGLVVEHGELGPVLVRPRDHHITPADLLA